METLPGGATTLMVPFLFLHSSHLAHVLRRRLFILTQETLATRGQGVSDCPGEGKLIPLKTVRLYAVFLYPYIK